MRSPIFKILAAVSLIGFCSMANSQTGYREMFSCTLAEGKTIEEVIATNSRWVAFMNRHVEGGGITSAVLSSVVGNASPDHFLYLDYFPSLNAWSAAKQATRGNAEGEALEAELAEMGECAENRLYRANQS